MSRLLGKEEATAHATAAYGSKAPATALSIITKPGDAGAEKVATRGAAAGASHLHPLVDLSMTFTGHSNQRNFVGLSVTRQGYIACGSEDNSVYCYYKVRCRPLSLSPVCLMELLW